MNNQKLAKAAAPFFSGTSGFATAQSAKEEEKTAQKKLKNNLNQIRWQFQSPQNPFMVNLLKDQASNHD